MSGISEVPKDTAHKIGRIAVIGAGVMGANTARNLSRTLNIEVPIFDISPEQRARVNEAFWSEGLRAQESVAELMSCLSPAGSGRIILLFVPAGAPVDEAMGNLMQFLGEGDVVVDCGNSNYRDTARRIRMWEGHSFSFVGAGVSGGQQGALEGPAIMVGANDADWNLLRDVLTPISAVAEDGQSSAQLVGRGAVGHFTKMVHNGIEYADLAFISEMYGLMAASDMTPSEISEVFDSWNAKTPSFLLRSACRVLREPDNLDPRGSLIDRVSDQAGSKGTGSWAVVAGTELGVDVGTIAQAFFSRVTSSDLALRSIAKSSESSGIPDMLESEIQRAYELARLIAYQQGLRLLTAGSAHYRWDIDLDRVLATWQVGSILSGQLITELKEMLKRDQQSSLPLCSEQFAEVVTSGLPALRSVFAKAAVSGQPVPALSAALSYLEMLSKPRLHTALVQLQRDHFGAHGYRRTDESSEFHTVWSPTTEPIHD